MKSNAGGLVPQNSYHSVSCSNMSMGFLLNYKPDVKFDEKLTMDYATFLYR